MFDLKMINDLVLSLIRRKNIQKQELMNFCRMRNLIKFTGKKCNGNMVGNYGAFLKMN